MTVRKERGITIFHSTDSTKNKSVPKRELQRMLDELKGDLRNTVDAEGFNWLDSVPLQRARRDFKKSIRIFGVATALFGAVWFLTDYEPAVLLIGGMLLFYLSAYPGALFLHYRSMKRW